VWQVPAFDRASLRRQSVVLFLVLLLGACASTKQYEPVASMTTLAPGNALIRVERQSGFMGSGRSLEISDNGKVVGQVGPGDSLVWQRPAGSFDLQLVAAALAASNPVPIKVNAEAGREYQFEVFWGGTTFQLQRK